MSGRYDDIIHLPRPKPRGHQEMTPWQRGAQFSPFAALTGFDGVVAETGRLTQSQISLGEDALAALNDQLFSLARLSGEHPPVTVTWFRPDARKAGGSYVTTVGNLKKLDEIQQQMVLTSGETIPLAQLLWVDFSEKA